jgi:PAS domain S-box-containing protein
MTFPVLDRPANEHSLPPNGLPTIDSADHETAQDPNIRILLLEDRPEHATLILNEVRRSGFTPQAERVWTEKDFVKRLDQPLDLILADYHLPDFDGVSALRIVRERELDIPFIIISGAIDEQIAVECMRNGAADYLLKDRLARLGSAVKRALAEKRMRRQTDAAKEQVRLHQRAIAALNEGVFITDHQHPGHRIIYGNAAFERITGYTAAEACGKSWRLLNGPETAPAAAREINKALREIRECRMVVRSYRKDKSEFWNDLSLSPVFDAQGRATHFVWVLSDITERRVAEQKRQQSEMLLSEAESVAHLGSFEIDLASDRITGSNEFFRLLGTSRDHGRITLTQLLEAVPAPARSLLEAIADYSHTQSGPLDWCRHIGEGEIEQTFHVRARTFTDDQGTLKRVFGTVQDITETRRAEEQLLEQARLLELTQDAILVRTLDDRIQFWNRGAEALYGVPRAEALGKKDADIFETDSAARDAATTAVCRNGEWHGEMRQTRRTGEELVIDARWTLVRNAEGAPKAILSVHTNITGRKKLEQQILHAQRMDAIGTLAAGVAHDLNNILAPIVMAAPLLRREQSAKEREPIVSMIENSAQRGADVVRQVVMFARGVEGKRIVLQPRHLLREVEKIARCTFPKSIFVHESSPRDLWTITGDATQLHQVLLNLCVNARDAMPDGGTLTLSAQNFQLDESYAAMAPEGNLGPYVLLTITDTGVGIPPGVIERMFDPFFTTKQPGKGTGLGLSTALGIVKSHGGFMKVYSEFGCGTTFKVFLPATATDAGSETGPDAPLPDHGNGELILLVDDEVAIRQVGQAILVKHGYEVITAEDGSEALAVYVQRAKDIRAVITDLSMPFVDGVALARALKKLNPDVRIIACSGNATATRIGELMSLDVKACLTKPFTAESLLCKLHEMLHPAGATSTAAPVESVGKKNEPSAS